MRKSIIADIKHFFFSGNMVNKLIVVNIIVGIVLLIFNIFFSNPIVDKNIYQYVLLSMDVVYDLKHPWVFITHLFVSGSIIHFIFNMLLLYWFGTLIGDFIGDKKVLPLYILGGLVGAFVYLIIGNIIFSSNNFQISGMDSVILAFASATAVLVPDYVVRVIIIGDIRLKIVVLIYVAIEFLYAFSSHNPVYLSYAGSVVFGWYYIYSMRNGNDLSGAFNKIWNKILLIFSFSKSKQKRNLTVKYKSGTFKSRNSKDDIAYKKELDRILDKIKRVGYDKLSAEEKEFLFLASKRE